MVVARNRNFRKHFVIFHFYATFDNLLSVQCSAWWSTPPLAYVAHAAVQGIWERVEEVVEFKVSHYNIGTCSAFTSSAAAAATHGHPIPRFVVVTEQQGWWGWWWGSACVWFRVCLFNSCEVWINMQIENSNIVYELRYETSVLLLFSNSNHHRWRGVCLFFTHSSGLEAKEGDKGWNKIKCLKVTTSFEECFNQSFNLGWKNTGVPILRHFIVLVELFLNVLLYGLIKLSSWRLLSAVSWFKSSSSGLIPAKLISHTSWKSFKHPSEKSHR